MKKHNVINLFFLISSILFGQKEITNNDIFYSNKFSQDYIYGLKSMKDGTHYTTLSMGDTVSIEKFSYNDFKKIELVRSIGTNQFEFKEILTNLKTLINTD